MEPALYAIAALLSLVGLSTIIRGIIYSIFTTKWNKKIYHVVCLEDENAEIVLRDTIEQINWHRLYGSQSVFALDLGLDKTAYEMCKLICKDYDIELCSPGELEDKIKQKYKD